MTSKKTSSFSTCFWSNSAYKFAYSGCGKLVMEVEYIEMILNVIKLGSYLYYIILYYIILYVINLL